MTTILFIAGSVTLFSLIYAASQGAPFVPTKRKDVQRFLEVADIKDGQKVYDLGCGDGRLVCAAASAGADAEGLEISILPFILAHTRRLFSENRKHIKISYKNIWGANLSDADVIYIYLMPEALPRLKAKLEKELKKETKIITYVWPIEDWTPVAQNETKGHPSLYLYRIAGGS